MANTVILYGIANCDTIRKARTWLADREIAYQFHDYRKQGLDRDLLESWVAEFGWETVVNRRGTSWRKIDPDIRESLDVESAIQAMLDNPALVKRPMLVTSNKRILGFSDADYSSIF